MAVVEEHAVVSEQERPPEISWGAVIAGLVLTVATTWLLTLLGAAMGMSIADASDTVAVGNGFGIGATIWMILTGIAAFLVGGLLAGRLAGKADESIGMLHGVTLWGTVLVLTMWLGYWGVSSMVSAGSWVVSSTATAAGSALSTTAATVGTSVAAGGQGMANAAENFAQSPMGARVAAEIKRSATQTVANADPEGGPDVDQQELARSLEQLDQQVFEEMAAQLIAGDTEQAKQTLTDATKLSESEINELVDGVATSIDESAAAETVRNQLQKATNAAAARISELGGRGVEQSEVRKALQQLDGQTLMTVSRYVINDQPEAAKNVLVANTTLSDREVEKIVDGASTAVQKELEEYRAAAIEVVEQASSYSQAVLWSAFAAAGIGLLAAILGGWMGAEAVNRLHVVAVHREARV